MATVGETSGVYKSKPARIKDALRKMWRNPAASKSETIGSAGTGHGSTTSPIGADGTVPYKPKPPRKGRPD